MTTQVATHQIPLHITSREDFTQVRESLRSSGFDNKNICRLLKIEAMNDLSRAATDEAALRGVAPQLALFIKAFILLQFIAPDEVEQTFEPATLSAFVALGLLQREQEGAGRFYAPILLHPVGDLFVVSDRLTNPDGSALDDTMNDAVFPAIFVGTLRFLDLISGMKAQEALDLCAGSGVGALALSKHIPHVVSADITDRATYYAKFNSLLNDRENVEVAQGDLYGAVEGRTFDCIVAHPPYVPASRDVLVFRDGGTTGETLVQRIIEGLPRYLRPGGTFFNVSYGIDTNEASFEERARVWLGETQHEFDVIFARKDEMSPSEAIEELIKREPQITPAEVKKVERAFADIGALRRVYGALVIHRRTDVARPPWTFRPNFSDETNATSFARAFRWREISAAPDFAEQFQTFRPRLEAELELKATYRVVNGEFVLSEYLLETEKPFLVNSRIDPQMVAVLSKCNGSTTVAELYQAAKEASLVPQSLTAAEFSSFLAAMIERGYLTVDELEER